MKAVDLLEVLDNSQDQTEITIGIDWLLEQGYPLQARFYQWRLAKKLEPYSYEGTVCCWLNPKTPCDYFLPDCYQRWQAIIPEQAIWLYLYIYYPYARELPHDLDIDRLSYLTRTEALKELRKRYVQATINGSARFY